MTIQIIKGRKWQTHIIKA